MKSNTFAKAAISSLLVATTMVGCTGAAFRPSATVVQHKGDPMKLAMAAEKALAARDGVKAISAAEAAVQAAPQNAAYRQLLGRAYVLAGRFASAQTALSDAISLGNSDPSTVISLALVQVAQGRADDARGLLVAHADTVPAGDYGLAMAMAGDASEGVRILSQAIQDPSATARTRQNLAYAYALDGRWKDARMIAGMDMDPLAANKRISDWAQLAEPSLAPMRVAALMGITIDNGDMGQPVALALAPAGDPVAMANASTDPLPPPPAQAEAPIEVAVADPMPVIPPVAQTPLESAQVKDRDAAIDNSKVKHSAVKSAAKALPIPAAHMQNAAFMKPVSSGASNWVVQLGAYENAAVAKEKWMVMAGGNATLAAFPVLTSQATVKGKPFHRLAISGFANRADAMAACRSIQSRRGQCFVRESAAGARPQRWAIAAKGRQFASR